MDELPKKKLIMKMFPMFVGDLYKEMVNRHACDDMHEEFFFFFQIARAGI